MSVTIADMTRLSEVCAGAWRGPWIAAVHGESWGYSPGHWVILVRSSSEVNKVADVTEWGDSPGHNARFIVEARDWMPKLIEEVARLREALENACPAWCRNGECVACKALDAVGVEI